MRKIFTFSVIILIAAFSLGKGQTVGGWFVMDSLDYTPSKIKVIDSNNLVAIGITYVNKHKLVRSSDGGTKWKVLVDEVNDTKKEIIWNSIDAPNNNTIVAVGDSNFLQGWASGGADGYKHWGIINVSNDGGSNWTRTILDSNTSISSVKMIDSLKGLAIVLRKKNIYNLDIIYTKSILYTNDGWKTYSTPLTYSSNIWLRDIYGFKNGDIVIRISDSKIRKGMIIRSDTSFTNFDTTFHEENFSSTNMIFTDRNNGAFILVKMIGNKYESQLFRTKDGGKSFEILLKLPDDSVRIISMTTVDFKNYYCQVQKTNSSFLYLKRSTDEGKTWSDEYSPVYSEVFMFTINDVKIITPFQSIMTVHATFPINQGYIIKTNGSIKLKTPEIKLLNFDNMSSFNPDSMAFYWDKIADSKEYRLIATGYSQWASGSTGINNFSGLPGRDYTMADIVTRDTALTIRNFNYSYLYTIKLMASNDSLTSDFNVIHMQTDDGTLTKTQFLTPSDGDTLSPNQTKIVFTKVPEANKYDILIQEDLFYGLSYRNVFTLWNYLETTLTIKQLSPLTKYRILIRAVNDRDVGPWALGSFITNNSPAGIEEERSIYSGAKICPQPVQQTANLTLVREKSENCSIQAADLFGRISRLWQGILSEGKNEIRLDMSGFAPGCYNLIIEGEGGREFVKLIKE